MPFCPDCGVEIGGAKRCPLCGAENPRFADIASSGGKQILRPECGEQSSGFAGSDSDETLTKMEKQKAAWEILSVALAITSVTVLLINLLVEKRISWSLYPLASIMFIWAWATAFLVLGRMPRLQVLLIAVAPPAFLLPGLAYLPSGRRYRRHYQPPCPQHPPKRAQYPGLCVSRLRPALSRH